MVFHWIDYSAEYADLIDSWLDDAAAAMTGIDSGWDDYWNAVIMDSVNFPGCKDYCKIVKIDDTPAAAVAFGYFRGDVTISEIVVDPALRSRGYGSKIIRELVGFSDVWFLEKINRFTAIVFLENIASQKAFQKAGFAINFTQDRTAFECTYNFDSSRYSGDIDF